MSTAADRKYIPLFNDAIRKLFSNAVRVTLAHPRTAGFFVRMSRSQRRAARVRAGWEARGVHVPPFLIISVTGRCNLACAGCYFQAQERVEEEMNGAKLADVVRQGRELGIGIMLLAGGEPFTRQKDLLSIASAEPGVIFPVFTNGLLLTETLVTQLKSQSNIIPVVSLEGHEMDTDARRGKGVSRQARATVERLRAAGVFFGISLTVTSGNLTTVTDPTFVAELMTLGCRLFFFVEYVPVREGTESLVLTEEQRCQLAACTDAMHDRHAGLFIAFPGDEQAYGGCLAAGRGFVHISPSGRVEPCPFAPYADTNVRDVSLLEALQSPFLKTIRESHERLGETQGGCALWAQREWVRSLLATSDTAGGTGQGRPREDDEHLL
jgi:MoaA/NifB/PqqE/SkfB family radical SAM enzyme